VLINVCIAPLSATPILFSSMEHHRQ
jgi:hypothetical protein